MAYPSVCTQTVLPSSSLQPRENSEATGDPPTQFGRAMRELGVTQVFAHSPEAKGRIERANGTFQDRLVSELRLAGASTLAEANGVLNEFLPRFNTRFGVPAAQTSLAYRTPSQAQNIDVQSNSPLRNCPIYAGRQHSQY
jgi:hypothetical protein